MADSIEAGGIPAVSIVNTGEEGMYEAFFNFEKSLGKNIKEAVYALAPQLRERMREGFTRGGSRDGEDKWVVTSNPTPLIDKGDLYNSIDSVVLEKKTEFIVVIGTDKDYARIHQEGGMVKTDVVFDKTRATGSYWIHTGSFRWIEIPKREFLFITDTDEEDTEEVISSAMAAASFYGK